jgi:hypothetical protein
MSSTKPKTDFAYSIVRRSLTMEYHSMSLLDLKQVAKNHDPKIKQYYILKRHELIKLLTMNALPQSYILAKKKRSDLIAEAKARGYSKFWNLKKSELLELLYPSLKEDKKDNNHAKKHDDPEHGQSD